MSIATLQTIDQSEKQKRGFLISREYSGHARTAKATSPWNLDESIPPTVSSASPTELGVRKRLNKDGRPWLIRPEKSPLATEDMPKAQSASGLGTAFMGTCLLALNAAEWIWAEGWVAAPPCARSTSSCVASRSDVLFLALP